MTRATLDWFGCSTYRLAAGEITIFLDAYIDRVPGAEGPPGASAASISVCDWILVGHSHIDHLWGAEIIAANTGATIIGSYETRRIMSAAGVPDEQLIAVSGGERIPLGDGVQVSVYPMLHSCWWAPYDDEHPDSPCVGFNDLDYFERTHRGSENMVAAIQAMSPAGQAQIEQATDMREGDGGTFGYLIETAEGSVFFKDTCGHWTGILGQLTADVAILGVSGRPHVDGETHQGSLADFVVAECELLQARRMIPSHHDDYMPGMSGPFGTEALAAAVSSRTSTEFVDLDYSGGYELFADLKARPRSR